MNRSVIPWIQAIDPWDFWKSYFCIDELEEKDDGRVVDEFSQQTFRNQYQYPSIVIIDDNHFSL